MRHGKNKGRALGLALWTCVSLFGAGCQDLWQELGTRDWVDRPAADGARAESSGPRVPRAKNQCPDMQTGEVELAGTKVRLWVADNQKPGGPLVVYWYGTGSSPDEVTQDVGPNLQALLNDGATVAVLTATTGRGDNTSTGTWYTGDLEVVDELVACAVEKLDIDVRRIYASGCSSGGIQAAVMAYQRSSYVAGAATNSGGRVSDIELEDDAHVPAIITTHGAKGVDVVIVDFAVASQRLDRDVVQRGGFAVDCDHGGGHCGAPPEIKASQWQFLKDHPFGVAPEPYADGLPDDFSEYCKIAQN